MEAPCSVAMETALRRLQAEESSVVELLSSHYGEVARQLFVSGEARSLKSFFDMARAKATKKCFSSMDKSEKGRRDTPDRALC